MSEYSEITVAEVAKSRLMPGGYNLVLRLLLENGKIGRHVYNFSYNYETDRSLVLFIELSAESRNVVVRMGTEEGDRKSYDAFQLFTGIKSGLSEHEWGYRVGYKRSLFSSDWENFHGFRPFGFTLIQPPLSAISSIGSGDFVYGLHKPPDPHILSLRIHNHSFRAVKIYKDIVVRDVLSNESFGPQDGEDY
jgi:hypothetical protein